MKYIDKIERLHIEWTSYCNARCPQCARTDNASLPLEMISMDSFKEWFTPELIKNVQYMYSCGNYGDPIAHPHCADFVDWFVDNGCSNVSLHTNGGARDTDFWKQLGERKIRVVFGIDGLEDTNHIYRVGVNWNKLISNVKTFINAGGQAEWAFLIFQHNEHQVEQAKKLATVIFLLVLDCTRYNVSEAAAVVAAVNSESFASAIIYYLISQGTEYHQQHH